MGIGSDVSKLKKIERILKKALEEEVVIIKDLELEITTILKQIKAILSQTPFDQITEKNQEGVLKPAKEAIISAISSLNPLLELDGRFTKVKEHAEFLKQRLETMKDTLAVYGSSKKAVIDFENNILSELNITLLRDFEQDITLNKSVEKSLQ